MKTVKEEAYLFADSLRAENETSRDAVKMIFEAGVDWALRWIDVKEELPPAGRQVLVKIKGTLRRHEGDSVVQEAEKPFVMYSLGGHDGSRDGRLRLRHLVAARRIIAFVLHDYGCVQTGRLINRHHSTVCYYHRTFRDDVKHDRYLKEMYETVLNLLNRDGEERER
jgi:hypothetical protein